MKTNTIYLSLILFFTSFFNGFSQETFTFSACVSDQKEHALIYADVEIEGENKIQTDVDGCIHFELKASSAKLKISYPSFLTKEITIKAGEHSVIALTPWLTNDYSTTVITTERIEGDFLLEGKVTDEDRSAIIGASIAIDGTPYGTITDLEGYFSLVTTEKCEDITISYTGYQSKRLEICSDEKTEVLLKEDAVSLDAVSVTAMGVEKRRSRRKVSHSEPASAVMSLADDRSPSLSSPPPPPSPYAYEESAAPEPATMSKETPLMMEGASADASIAHRKKDENALPSAGQLTAGEINDFSKWDMWSDISQEDLAMHRGDWKQYADHRYTLQLTTPNGLAVVNAKVELTDGQGNIIWRARTNNSGQAEMWAHYFSETKKAANGLSISGHFEGQSFSIPNVKSFKEGINFYALATECNENPVIDIAFVVDATGSMSDEIQYLQAELLNVIARVQDSLPAADIQTGSVFYKDKTDNYLTKIAPFNKDASATVKFIQEQSAGGGGDFPEAVDDAMEDAIEKLDWRDEATSRILFLVLDAPPHQEKENLKRLNVAVTKAAKMGIQIIPVACSGINKSTEYLMRSMALATNGTYTFITDHSGIGNAHIEPSTDEYTVEFLNDVMIRLCVDRSRLQKCDEAPISQMNNTPLQIGGEQGGIEWSFYPNPTSGPVNFMFEEDGGMLYLADAHGKVLQGIKTDTRMAINLNRYPAGTYWLKHEDINGHWTQSQVVLVRR